jgi:putative transposase
MARPLSNDLRERVVARHEAGESIRSVALVFGLAPSTVSKWAQRCRETGSVSPAQFGGYRRRLLEPHRDRVHALVSQMPHRSVRALRDELAALGIEVSEETLRSFLHREGLSFKKNRLRD